MNYGERPEARLRSKLLVKVFHNTDPNFSSVPTNSDHSEGRLMWGDPRNHSLGRIHWTP
jgi:hypothetical protein